MPWAQFPAKHCTTQSHYIAAVLILEVSRKESLPPIVVVTSNMSRTHLAPSATISLNTQCDIHTSPKVVLIAGVGAWGPYHQVHLPASAESISICPLSCPRRSFFRDTPQQHGRCFLKSSFFPLTRRIPSRKGHNHNRKVGVP